MDMWSGNINLSLSLSNPPPQGSNNKSTFLNIHNYTTGQQS